MDLIILAGLALASFGAWWVTRDLRRPWYSRFAIELFAIGILLLAATLGGLGAWYDSVSPAYGEQE